MAAPTDIPNVVAGQPIEATWGNTIRDRSIGVAASVAALPTTSVPDGSVCYVVADGNLYTRHTGRWWVRKSVVVSKTTDGNGIVTITAADLGLVSITFAQAQVSGGAAAVTARAFSGMSGTFPGTTITVRTFRLATGGGVDSQVNTANNNAATFFVTAEGYVT